MAKELFEVARIHAHCASLPSSIAGHVSEGVIQASFYAATHSVGESVVDFGVWFTVFKNFHKFRIAVC